MRVVSERSESAKNYAVAISAVVVPVIVAVLGYRIQSSISDNAIRKDYVQLAINILREAPDTKNDPDTQHLRTWAIDVVDGYSPIPLSPAAKDELRRNQLGVSETMWREIASGEGCADYYIITNDEGGFDECVKRRDGRLLEKP
jgi:hypothetical protein